MIFLPSSWQALVSSKTEAIFYIIVHAITKKIIIIVQFFSMEQIKRRTGLIISVVNLEKVAYVLS